jgi:dTDP-4-amino-4,6-dideoxygalactose transaminase
MIPLNDLQRHVAPLQSQYAEAAARVIGRGRYILGHDVSAFEREFADYCGVAECVGVGNGTDALELALRAAGAGPGDEVIGTANAGMYWSIAALAAGARPVYVDIRDADLLLDPPALEVARTKRTRAIVMTHLYGSIGNVASVQAWASGHGIALIEDCAQAHGARIGGRRAGSFGTLSCFSFYPTKNLGALGDGGAVVTNDPVLAAKVRALRQYGWEDKYRCVVRGGRNSRLDDLQAAFLRIAMPRLDAWNQGRRNIAARYAAEINNPSIRHTWSADELQDPRHVAHLYVIRVAAREALMEHLLRHAIASDIHYPVPDHRQPVMAPDTRSVVLAITERACETVLSLPCFPELAESEIDAVIAACNSWQSDTRS